jgi:hypothetical protein
MPYIQRDDQGRIESLHRHASALAAEFAADDDPQVLAFVGVVPADTGAGSEADSLVRMDASFVRVIEDLIDLLMVKNVITLTDLPIQAQNKLLARKSFRDKAGANSLRLFGDAGSDGPLLGPD